MGDVLLFSQSNDHLNQHLTRDKLKPQIMALFGEQIRDNCIVNNQGFHVW